MQLKAKHRTLFESTLKNCQKENLIISAEGLSCLTQDEVFKLNATCLGQGFQTEAVGYLREPKSKIDCGFQQRVKSVHKFSLNKLHRVYPSCRETLSKYYEVFDEGNVSYWTYGTHTLFDNCVVKDFLFRLRIKPHQLTVDRSNESLSLDAIRFFIHI